MSSFIPCEIARTLLGLLNFLDLAKESVRRVWTSISWALTYNIAAISLVSEAFEALGFRVEHSSAVVAELVSLVPVIVSLS
jgi:cation transport ATPase